MLDVAVITSVRNDTIFLKKWVDYYGENFGRERLFVFIDGFDQQIPHGLQGVNFLRIPFKPSERGTGDRRRARMISDLSRSLFRHVDCVLAMDVDEFILPDPKQYKNLADFLERCPRKRSISGLGLDVGHKEACEQTLDLDKPFLDQRRFAHVSATYTKPSISFRPVTWGGGFHRVKGRNYWIAPDLYNLHFGMIDRKLSAQKSSDASRIKSGWHNHLARREALFDIVSKSDFFQADDYLATARRQQSFRRPWYAWNKPKMLANTPVVELPGRFRGAV